jgi:CubicO group peptidase (beta-lactamase class C family)
MYRFTALAGLLLATPPLAAQSAADKLEQVEQEAPLLLARHDVPSVGIAYIENGEIAWVRHFGYQTWGFPANEETLYNVASLTKPVTAEVILRLAQAGRFSLDTPLADHHMEEDVADDPRSRELTARLVMRHRTGFPNWRYETEGTLTFLRDPDTEVGYSGEGYEWMMKAAAAAVGEDFEKLARDLVFEPADMPLTGYTLANNWVGHLAMPYKADEGVYNVVRREPSASDDMRTTPREYARFMLSVFEGDAVSPELREEQFTIRHEARYRPACKGEDRADFCPTRQGWGLGWTVYEWPHRKIYEHSGGDHGERALALYDPETRRGMVLMTNGAEGFEVIKALVETLDGDPIFLEFVNAPFG